jgi:CubicO group peptidase (beta-lactamase class C family)
LPDNPTLTQPVDFTHPADPSSLGMQPEKLQALAAIFDDLHAQGLNPAGQMVVLRHGWVVFDRVIGESRKAPVTPDTPFLLFSSTKPFTAACIHLLVERGLVEYDAPIASYWHEFGCKGKETATIRHTLLHQAGIPNPWVYRQIPFWPFWGLVTRTIAAHRAQFVPGSQCVYHLLNTGFILGEVVRRVSGKMIDFYFTENISQPLGMSNSWMRIPRLDLKRSPLLRSLHPSMKNHSLVFNTTMIRRALMPAATMHSTARDMAVFYQMMLNEGQYAGRRLFKAETVRTILTPGYEGIDTGLDSTIRWALGFELGVPNNPPPLHLGKGVTLRTFAHYGIGTNMAWADPESGLVAIYLTNGLMRDGDDAAYRWEKLADAVWDSLA